MHWSALRATANCSNSESTGATTRNIITSSLQLRDLVHPTPKIFLSSMRQLRQTQIPKTNFGEHFARCQASPPPSSGRPITVGTLIYIAQQHGANFEPWRRLVPDLPILPPHLRPPLKGGLYSPDEALELFNSHFLIGRRYNEAAGVHRINDDESLTYLKAEYFKLEVQHVSVIGQRVHADTFWKSHRQRHQRIIVFKPGGIEEPSEYNLWRGFGIEPRKG